MSDIEYNLSFQEKQIATQIMRLLSCGNEEFEIKNIRDKVCLEQYSHLSAVITRLVRKGALQRTRRGFYKFCDNKFLNSTQRKKYEHYR